MLILDTNVISETLKPMPDETVLEWLESQPRSQLYTTAVAEAEILYGIALMPKSSRQDKLVTVTQAIFDEDFENKVLPFDSRAAEHYAELAARRKAAGKPISQLDAMIAAITRTHQARLVTRNAKDFADCGIDVINPWSP